MVRLAARILAAIVLASALAGCGDIGSAQIGPGKFSVYGSALYADEGILKKKAAYLCPAGFTVSRESKGSTADDFGDLILFITCNEPSPTR